ncbi:hypothetical protein NJ7G_0405 [Natrinema sp. J7-2]|nr:hypothetical protein NJ7G_0405 [Natrinema sp. J7-2]
MAWGFVAMCESDNQIHINSSNRTVRLRDRSEVEPISGVKHWVYTHFRRTVGI